MAPPTSSPLRWTPHHGAGTSSPLIPGDKRPAVTDWETRATTDRERITLCWTHAPYNVGIATGPSRLVVVDLDVPKCPDDTPPAA